VDPLQRGRVAVAAVAGGGVVTAAVDLLSLPASTSMRATSLISPCVLAPLKETRQPREHDAETPWMTRID
jgi:hypothetical protein